MRRSSSEVGALSPGVREESFNLVAHTPAEGLATDFDRLVASDPLPTPVGGRWLCPFVISGQPWPERSLQPLRVDVSLR